MRSFWLAMYTKATLPKPSPSCPWWLTTLKFPPQAGTVARWGSIFPCFVELSQGDVHVEAWRASERCVANASSSMQASGLIQSSIWKFIEAKASRKVPYSRLCNELWKMYLLRTAGEEASGLQEFPCAQAQAKVVRWRWWNCLGGCETYFIYTSSTDQWISFVPWDDTLAAHQESWRDAMSPIIEPVHSNGCQCPVLIVKVFYLLSN